MANAGKLLAVLFGAFVLWGATCAPFWKYGGYDIRLKVHIAAPPGSISSVACLPCRTRARAEHAVATLPRPIKLTEYLSEGADPFTGVPLEVKVPADDAYSLVGFQVRYEQFEYLAVIAERPDGSRVGKVVDIPDGRVSKEVTVAFP